MSRKQKIKHMSSDELKAKLYSHFQKSGSLDHLRAQLRGQLVSELFKIAEPVDPDKFPDICDVEKCLLPLQVCNWLVYDHLSRQDYQYSLSTFVTEAQLPYPEKFLTAGDVLGLLGLKNTADSENISILYSKNNELGFKHSLLLAIIKAMFNVSNKDLAPGASHQNSEAINSKKVVQDDQKESLQHFVQNKSAATETSFQDLPQFKQKNLNESFLTNDDARSAEMSYEQFQSFKEENEKEMQKMRHRLLEELDNLHSQKRRMQLDLEYSKSELKKEENKLLKEKEMLKEKEVILEKELAYEFEIKIRNVQSEFVEKMHFKDKEIESLKRKLSEKEEKLAIFERELVSEKEMNSHREQELKDFKNRTKTFQDKYAAALDENTSLQRKFENMSDYAVLKEEVSIKSREVTRLQNEIKDLYQKSETERKKYVETVRNLENNLDMKESQLIQAKEEVDDAKTTFKKEQALWNRERKKFEHELRELKDCYETVIEKLEEKNEELEELHQTIHILNYKLTTNVINTAKSEPVGLYKSCKRPLRNQKIDSGYLSTKKNHPFQQQSERDYDSKFKFFLDKKSKYSALKKEENAVQEKYSMIFSTMPENISQVSYSRNYNFSSIPKKSTESYNVFSKPFSVNSSFNYEKRNASDITKNPYSLSDVRQMLTFSLLPYKTSKQADASNFATSSLGLKSNYYSFQKQYGLTETNDNFSTLNTIRHRSSLNEDDNTSENPLRFSSRHKNVSESRETVLSSKEQNKVTKSDENRNTLQENNESAKNLRKKSLKDNENETSSDVEKNVASTAFQNSKAVSEHENINQSSVVTSQDQIALVDASQHMASKTVEKEPEPNFSLFVNLDDAWKKKSSVTYLSFREDRTNEMNSKDIPGSSLPSSYVVSNNRSAFSGEQPVFDSNHREPTKIGSKDILNESTESMHNKSAENVSNYSGEGISADGSHLERNKDKEIGGSQNLENEPSLSDKLVDNTAVNTTKCNAANASDELQILYKEKETEDDANIDEELSFRETDQIDNDKVNKEEKTSNYEEQENTKSSEKPGNNDSSSEQSELNLSCGNEIEQDKEDSNSW